MPRVNTDITIIKSAPRWAGDYFDPEIAVAHFPARVDASLFTDSAAVKITVGSAGAAQNATSIPLTAALVFSEGVTKIPSGTRIFFGGAKLATLSQDYTGGTSLAVLPIPTAIVSGDTATYKPFGARVRIPGGTFMGRTYAERDAGAGWGPVDPADNEVYLSCYEISDANLNPDVEFYRHARTVKMNYLPEWTNGVNISGTSALLNLLNSKYVCIKGVG